MAERIGSTRVRYPLRFVVAGDSGAWADPTADGIFTQASARTSAASARRGRKHPADRGSLFHVTQITITEEGAVSGKVLQAFESVPGRARLTFG